MALAFFKFTLVIDNNENECLIKKFKIMNLENLNVQELSLEDQINIDGGGIWSHIREFIKGVAEGMAA